MMGWIIGGAVALFVLTRNSAPVPVAVNRVSRPVAPMSVVTAPVLAAAIPAVVLPSTVAQQPVIISGGNEPLVPLSASATTAIQKYSYNTLSADVMKNLAIANTADTAAGFGSLGMPATQFFSPLQIDPATGGFANWDSFGGAGAQVGGGL